MVQGNEDIREIPDGLPVITIVGCGFIGSHIAEEISKMFFSQDLAPHVLRFVDFDKWEERNAANQNVSQREAKNGEFKAVTCARYANQYENVYGEAVVDKITADNAHDILKGSILIIDAVDNIPTRQLLWALGKGGVAPCMHVGISRQGDGMINWSTPVFDTFPFNPINVMGRNLQEQDFHEPPCEMYKYRAAGTILFNSIAKSLAFYFGRDPWDMLGLGANFDTGHLTCWTSNIEGGAVIQVDDYYMDQETGFFPQFVKEL